ncbi:MAG: hypothetical protein ACRC62_11130 [Microcoleus sp.]
MSIAEYYSSGSVPPTDAAFLPTLNGVPLERGTPARLLEMLFFRSGTDIYTVCSHLHSAHQPRLIPLASQIDRQD